MQSPAEILCDGCGQPASPEHIARRLKRLESATRYRPIHVQALFLGAVSPAEDRADLYSAQESFTGEGAELLRALEVESAGRSVEAALTDFQRRGYLLTHFLECPEVAGNIEVRREAMRRRLPATLARIRRSYKPKRVVMIGSELTEFVSQVQGAGLGATVILRDHRPLEWNELGDGMLVKLLSAPLESL
jgi:hypothetical protein